MYRAPSPYGQDNRNLPPQHYAPQTAQPYPASPGGGGQIVPGSITYTTSSGPDGRMIYHPFKAVAASYQTANGIVSGIQWVPAEATQILPAGAQPANAEFTASWNRGYLGKDDKLKEWQREEEKRKRREEKESTKRLRGQQERSFADSELQKARELDAIVRERRKSFNAGGAGVPPGIVSFPSSGGTTTGYPAAPGATGYPASPYQNYADPLTGAPQYGPAPGSGGTIYGRERKHSNVGGYDALNRQFNDLDLDREREHPERERKISGLGRPHKYTSNAGDERPVSYGNYATSTSPYSGPYPPPAAPGYATSGGKYSNPSPNVRPGELPYVQATTAPYPGSSYSSSARGAGDPIQRSTTPYGSVAGGAQVYPRGHILEGQPIPPRSRASSPMPGAYPPGAVAYSEPSGKIRSHSPRPPPSPRLGGISPHIPGAILPEGQQQLPPPEGFSRPANPNSAFTAFDTMKIQDMDDFLVNHAPRMPGVVKSHDVYPEDWHRLMNDIKLAWSGRLPVPGDISRDGQPPRRTTLVADLIDLWNTSFFLSRGIEVVLYKGRERRSGPKVGVIDYHLPDDDSDPELSETESEEEEDESELEEYLARAANAYGRPADFDPGLIARRRREAREEKRRRREKRAKQRARAKGKKHTLYLTYVPVPGAPHGVGGMAGGYSPGATYMAAAGGYGRHGGY